MLAWNDISSKTVAKCYQHCDIRTAQAGADTNANVASTDDVELDQAAVRELEGMRDTLATKRPELFSCRIDIQSLLNNYEEDIIGGEIDILTVRELLEENDEDEMLEIEDDSVEVPKVSRQEVTAALSTLAVYLRQQEEGMEPEQAMVKRVWDQIENKRLSTMKQTTLHSFIVID